MQLKELTIDGKKYAGFEGEIAPGTNLVFIKGAKGFFMCGYLNIETAERFGNIAAIVSGIKSIDDMLNSNIAKVSSKALEAGITAGMTVKEALKLI